MESYSANNIMNQNLTMDITSDMSMPPDEEEENNDEIYSFEQSRARIPKNDLTYHPDDNKGGRMKMAHDEYSKFGKRKNSKA